MANAPEETGLVEAFAPLVRMLTTMFVGAVGLLIFANVGSLAYPNPPGVGPVIFGVFGLSIFLLMGCCMTGAWRDLLPKEDASVIMDREFRKTTGVDTSLVLVVTVKEVRHVLVHGRMYEAAENYLKPEVGFTFSRPQLFVELSNGTNPPKATCVKSDGKFNEQFQLNIRADMELLISVKDQELYGAQPVGFVSLEIDRDILRHPDGLPLTMRPKLSAGQGFTLRHSAFSDERADIELTFDVIDRATTKTVHEQVSHLHEDTSLLEGGSARNEGGGYGATKFLSAVQYDRHNKALHELSEKQFKTPQKEGMV